MPQQQQQRELQPSERYRRVMKICRWCSAACGADVIDANYKMGFVTFLVTASIALYFGFTFFTIYDNVADDWTILLESLCMVGSVIQGIAKLATGIVHQRALRKTNAVLEDIYAKYEAIDADFRDVMNASARRAEFYSKLVGGTYAVVIGAILVTPFVLLVATGKRYLVMQFLLPGLNTDTDHGYLLTVGLHSFCLFFGSFGNFAGDMIFLTFITHVKLYVDVFRAKIAKFNAKLEEELSTKEEFLDILKWHAFYTSFSKSVFSSFFWVVFIQVATSGMALIMTIFIIVVGEWIGSYMYLILVLMNLYSYCGIGTLVEVANSDFTDAIYEINWYLLRIKDQKMVRFMLMQSQTPIMLTVGGVLPLSVNTALQVTKTVYSFMMMLLNFVQ